MKASEVLKAARKRVEDGRSTYICFALEDTLLDEAAIWRATSRILHLLHPYSSLEGWLQGKKHARHAWVGGGKKLKQTRLNWIDDLIKYFEARGD